MKPQDQHKTRAEYRQQIEDLEVGLLFLIRYRLGLNVDDKQRANCRDETNLRTSKSSDQCPGRKLNDSQRRERGSSLHRFPRMPSARSAELLEVYGKNADCESFLAAREPLQGEIEVMVRGPGQP